MGSTPARNIASCLLLLSFLGALYRLATPVQLAACLFPFLAIMTGIDAALPIFKRGYVAVFYSKESDILAKLIVSASLLFLSGTLIS